MELSTRGESNSIRRTFVTERGFFMNRHFGEICRMRSTTSAIPMVTQILYPRVRSLLIDNYTKKEKKKAIKALEAKCKLKITEAGIFIHKEHPYLAALVDGIMRDMIVIIECPYIAKDVTPEEAYEQKIGKIDKYFNKNMDSLNPNNAMFNRVMGALEITEKSSCLFVLWTQKGMVKCSVERKKEFWQTKMVTTLRNFYHRKLIPEIIDSRHKRSMPIRESMNFDYLDYETFIGLNKPTPKENLLKEDNLIMGKHDYNGRIQEGQHCECVNEKAKEYSGFNEESHTKEQGYEEIVKKTQSRQFRKEDNEENSIDEDLVMTKRKKSLNQKNVEIRHGFSQDFLDIARTNGRWLSSDHFSR